MEDKIYQNFSEGLFFVVSGPAGTGKNTLVNQLVKEFDTIVESISFTTRKPRPDEVDGREYFFISKENFFEKKKEGALLESAEVFGNYYGTSKEWVEKQNKAGKHVVLVIDTQGAMQLRKTFSAIFIFVKPPSLEELKKRLLSRNSESLQEVEKRLSWAKEELKLVSFYDYVFINEDLDLAYDILRSIVIAEIHKIRS